MRLLRSAVAIFFFGNLAFCAAPDLIVPTDFSLGRNLEVFASVRLSRPAPDGGLEITLTSSDPARLLLASLPDKAGSKSIVLKINPGYVESPDFYMQGFGDAGTVSYTASAPSFGTATGTITLAHSAVMIVGPFEAPAFKTTTGMPAKITVYSAMLDASGKLAQQQPIAGGLSVGVKIATSDPKVGNIATPSLTLTGGTASSNQQFKPVSAGQTTLAVNVPAGFTAPQQGGSVAANVELPGIGIAGEVNIGKDLQIQAQVLLGEPAPPGGLDVKLTSADAKRLILSAGVDEVGSESVTLHIPAGKLRVPYFIQGLGDSGTVNYTAAAPEYRSRTAPVTLRPSGVMIVFSPYGPPDEANVLRILPPHDPRPFSASLSSHTPIRLTLWTTYLDPTTLRGADITAQRLRAGITAVVGVKSSNPEVARVTSPIKIGNASDFAMTDLVPLSVGQAVISVSEPQGFTTPSNATSVTATVKE